MKTYKNIRSDLNAGGGKEKWTYNQIYKYLLSISPKYIRCCTSKESCRNLCASQCTKSSVPARLRELPGAVCRVINQNSPLAYASHLELYCTTCECLHHKYIAPPLRKNNYNKPLARILFNFMISHIRFAHTMAANTVLTRRIYGRTH